MPLFDVEVLGIQGLEIEGSLTVLLASPGNPTVFLLDEHHLTPLCISQNIQNAQSVIDMLGDPLIGVESHAAYEVPSDDTRVNEHPEVAEHFHAMHQIVRGVEQVEVFEELAVDCSPGGTWPAADARHHPNNYIRTRYFLAALFKMKRQMAFNGPLILNSGKVHNDHIEQMIASNVVHLFAGQQASYIRIRATAYPTPPAAAAPAVP